MYASSILAVAFATLAVAQILPGSDCGSLPPQYQAACYASRAATSTATPTAPLPGSDCASLPPQYQAACYASRGINPTPTTPLIGSDCASLPPQYQAACYASRGITPTPVPALTCDQQRTACNSAPNANHAQCAAEYYQCTNPYANNTTAPFYTTTITTQTCNAAGCYPCTITTTVPIVPVITVTPCVNCKPITTVVPAITTAPRPVFTGAASAQQVSGALLIGAGLIAALL